MAASALTKGKASIAGEGYKTKVVDFGRSADLTITLSGSDQWPLSIASAGATNTQPSDDIEAWHTTFLKNSRAVSAYSSGIHQQVMAYISS